MLPDEILTPHELNTFVAKATRWPPLDDEAILLRVTFPIAKAVVMRALMVACIEPGVKLRYHYALACMRKMRNVAAETTGAQRP